MAMISCLFFFSTNMKIHEAIIVCQQGNWGELLPSQFFGHGKKVLKVEWKCTIFLQICNLHKTTLIFTKTPLLSMSMLLERK